MVEPQIVVLVVAGRVPLATRLRSFQSPNPKQPSLFGAWNLGFGISNLVPVAQPDRASDFGSEGWGFESLQARHSSSHESLPPPTR